MRSKVIQVPLDEELLDGLDDLSRRRGQSRSALIREACRRYIRAIEEQELDRVYEEGYRRLPESTAGDEAYLQLASEAFDPEETW